MRHSVSYQTEDGAIVTTEYEGIVSHVNYTARREEFCRRMSTAEYEPVEVYCQVWEKDWKSATEDQRLLWRQAASRLMSEAHVKLRIDQLKTPVVRKYAKKFEYTLQRAFEQCDEAYQLAKIENEPKAMLKAIELQGKFAKLLADQLDVRHHVGLLDEASTEVLLGMMRAIEKKRASVAKIVGGNGAAGEIVEAEGVHGPALVPSAGPI